MAHRAIDGSTVELNGPVDLSRPFTSMLHVEEPTILRELTVAPLAAVDALPIRITEEYRRGEAGVVVGHREELDRVSRSHRRDTFAVWRGPHHALVLFETGASSAAILAVLDRLDLEDDPAGLAVGGPGVVPTTARLVKEVPGVGLVEVAPLVSAVARRLPRWSGTPVPGGDLFREGTRPDAESLLLVAETAVVTVMPDGGRAEADRATRAVAALEVTWTAPS